MTHRSAFRRTASSWTLLCVCLLSLATAWAARADDGIFPPSNVARASIDFDGRGFLLGGQRTFLASGSLHYPRVPRALWRDRLLRFKRAGFNTVQTYVFWNYHEPQPGKFDFTGEKDLDAYLKLIHSLGMYAIVRVGPYVCAEWDSGGYPVWLRFQPGVHVREDNPAFMAAMDRYWDHVLPIVRNNQIHRGGSVVMVQLENEHPQGWGTDLHNGYFRHMREKAQAAGIEVPFFFSGLHHGSDPAGEQPWDSANRKNPWYTTEFWPGWFTDYGPLNASDFRKFDRGTWKILAYGGNGYNYYMLHGGTNFATWNNDEDASSYDYGAAVGQCGDLRPIYYHFKRAAWFARSFQSILEDSTNATELMRSFKTAPSVRVTARTSPAGTILFLDNPGNSAVQTQVTGVGNALYPASGPLTLEPGEIVPVVQGFSLPGKVTLSSAPVRILGIAPQGDTTTMVIYGQPGTPAEMTFQVPADTQVETSGKELHSTGAGQLQLTATFSPNVPSEYRFRSGNRRVRVLAMNTALADHTWFVEAGSHQYVITGPDYVGDVEEKGGRLRINAESAWSSGPLTEVVAWGSGESPLRWKGTPSGPEKAGDPPKLTAWELRVPAEIRPEYADREWLENSDPVPMGADGDSSAYAWYRTRLRVPKAGAYSLNFSDAGDWLAVFVNGERAGSTKVMRRFKSPIARSVNVTLRQGDNTIAVLAAHYGRDKIFNYLGPIDRIDAKGLSGPVALSVTPQGQEPVTGWSWMPTSRPANGLPNQPPNAQAEGWQRATLGEDVFNKKKGWAWYRTTLPAAAGGHHELHFEGVDDNGTIYLNGKRLLTHEGWDSPFEVDLDSAWSAAGPNELAVLVENTANTGGIMPGVLLRFGSQDPGTPVKGWRMHGGIGEPIVPGAAWQAFSGTAPATPVFYRAHFTTTPPGEVGPHPIYRVSFTGLSRGFVWLNGHNLGRYPEKIPLDAIYLPECWLKKGENEIAIFDEDGNRPDQVRIETESAASRISQDLSLR